MPLFGAAFQNDVIFHDTIYENIRFGRDVSKKEAMAAAQDAQAVEFIEEKGLDAMLAIRGMDLSGGQKQRLSLARALAIKPAILILDDTTSAVDMETEKYIQDSLRNLDFPCTKIIIAQRISSTKDADMIIILDDGKITEMGTHDELIAKKGYYYEVFKLQNDGFGKEAV